MRIQGAIQLNITLFDPPASITAARALRSTPILDAAANVSPMITALLKLTKLFTSFTVSAAPSAPHSTMVSA